MRVNSIRTLSASILKTHPPQPDIRAEGTVNQGGWTNIRLAGAPVIDPGRILAYDLIGDPPSDAAIQVITPVQATLRVPIPGVLPEIVLVNAAENSLAVPVAGPLSDGLGLPAAPPGYSEAYAKAEYRAIRLGHEVLIHAAGTLPNTNSFADIRLMPWRVYPPQFGFLVYSPEISLPTLREFSFATRFPYPPKETVLVVYDADGPLEVPILLPDLEPARGESASASGATGYGGTLQMAVDEAIRLIPPAPRGPIADELFRFKVVEQGKLVGGFPGFNTYFATVVRSG